MFDHKLISAFRTDSAIIQIAQDGQYLPGFTENSTIPFEAGRTYRLRLINMSALAMFRVWLDGHDMEVIEVDGVDTERYPIDLVTLSVAQRVSVLVRARNDTTSDFLLHANMDPDMFDVVPDALQLNVTSTIVYNAGNPVEQGTEMEYFEFPDQDLVPVRVEAAAPPDVEFELGFNFDTSSDGTPRCTPFHMHRRLARADHGLHCSMVHPEPVCRTQAEHYMADARRA